MLKILQTLPAGLLACEAADLYRLLGAPTLLHLSGRRPEPVFLSVLLHGNENTGFYAVREVLRRYQDRQLPRALSIFFGNVAAAEQNVRRLDGQPDYNRVWPGCEGCENTPEHAMMAQVVDELAARNVFVSIDVHNNTGVNPHYACVNRIDHRYLHLATLFSRTVVYFTRPRGVQSLAFTPLCPAVTIECGQPGQAHGIEHARDFIEASMQLATVPVHPVAHHDIDLFHTVAIVKVPEHVTFGFGGCADAICLLPDLDHLNFRELPQGTQLGWIMADQAARLEAWDERGRDISERFFAVVGDEIRTRRPVMPSMFTLNKKIIRQDCLGYLMERYELVSE